MRNIAYSIDLLLPGLYFWLGPLYWKIGGAEPVDVPYRYPGQLNSFWGFAVILSNQIYFVSDETSFDAPKPQAIEKKFRRLKKWLENDTKNSSLSSLRINHPAHQQIVEMGAEVVPFLLQDLKETRSHWFHALSQITGENPVSKESAGRVNEMVEAWLKWGEDKRLINLD